MASTLLRIGSSCGKNAPVFSRSTMDQLRRNLTTSRIVNQSNELRPLGGQADSLLDIGTRSIFNSDHDIFRESCRKFFETEVAPHHAQWEKDGNVSRDLWLRAGEQGILGVSTKADHHGIGADFLSAAIVVEEQAYVNASGPGFGMHSEIVIPYLSRYGSKQQIDKYIPELVAGRKIGALAMSEPGAGSDLQGIRTNAKRDGDDWILNGSKTFITNGHMCDLVIVVAITNPKAKSIAHGTSLFLLDAGTPGFKKGKKLNKVGLKAQDTSELFFEDVRLSQSAILGQENKGFYHMMQDLPQERLLIAIGAAASCESVFEQTRTYVRERKAFGKTLADLQTVQHKLAEIKTETCVGRAFVDQCLQYHNEGRLDTATASMAKYWLTDLQNKIAYNCQQLFGGWGYMMEYNVAKNFIDARVQSIYGGSNEIMKELIARPIIKS